MRMERDELIVGKSQLPELSNRVDRDMVVGVVAG
jgi:hypothetical protein